MKTLISTMFCFLFIIHLLAQSGGIRIEGITMLVAAGSPKIVIQDGDFYSDAAHFDIGESEVIFKGDAIFDDTTIKGISFLNFYNLTIDKSDHGIKLKNNIYVENELKFTDGLFDLNGNSVHLSNNGTLINESEDSRIIETDGGTVIKTVHLNNPNNENPGNLGAEITCAQDLGLTTITRGHDPLTIVGEQSIQRHFDINPTNNVNLNATLRLHYLEVELNGIEEADLSIFRNGGGNWTDMRWDNLNKDENWLDLSSIEHFSVWTLAETNIALPVDWLTFTAKSNDQETVDLEWKTASEVDNHYYYIQKSSNGLTFSTIGKIDAIGHSLEIQTYQFNDTYPFEGNNYYRIQQIDYSGKYSYSEIRTVHFNKKEIEVSIFPNPTQGHFQIEYHLENATHIEMRITDFLGRHLQTLQSLELVGEGTYLNDFTFYNVPKGIYFLTLQQDNLKKNYKIIFQ